MKQKLIRLSKSVIGDEEKRAVVGVLDREYLGMGKEVQEFEQALTNFFGRPAVCVNTGTAALHLALQAIGIKKGDEVLVQSLTYLATYQAISAAGATPISCEVYENTLTINLEDAKKKITSSTKAIIPVHYAGCPGNLDDIYEFAYHNNLRVIEDSAHAFGTIYQEKLIGSFGDIACFSFDGIKNITCGEGGAIVTSDSEVIRKVSDARLLGIEKDTEKRYAGTRSWEFDVIDQGWRFHMSNIMAAIGIVQFKKFNKFKEKRQFLAKMYQIFLAGNEKITMLDHDYDEVVPHIFVIRVDSSKRNHIKKMLDDKGIQTGLHYKPNHLLGYYSKMKKYNLPITEKIYGELITLPLHPDMGETDVNFICNNLLSYI